MQLCAGTSGYSYKEWKGSFYPEKLRASEMLRFYAGQFDAVEINNTFYRMPDEETLAGWVNEVPEGFRFALKAPRRISHLKRLRDTEADVAEFVRRAAALGAKRGPVLVQLPPFMKADVALLQQFLTELPDASMFAFEFRSASWFDDAVYELLRTHGAALCVAESEDLEVPLVATAPWGYLRLRSLDYDDARLRKWVERIGEQAWSHVFVFFKHEDEALGPRFARRFRELWDEVHALR